ncbi:MAG TPA: TolC family protein, partial [bacterium]|nr:TolC family protein [bacterium]
LDVLGAVGGTGLSGTGRDVSFGDTVFPSDIRGDFNDSFEQVVNRDFPTWSVGLEMTFPIGLREDRGERDRLHGLMMRGEQQLEAQRRELEEDVRARHREVTNGTRRVEVAQAGVDAAAEQVRVGIIEYRSGMTTAFELTRLAEDYARAEQQLSQALVRTAKSAAELRQLLSQDGTNPEGTNP